MVDWLNWMSVTVLRAESGRGALRQPSALMRRMPPPSMRQPPSALVAVLVLAVLARTSVPGPSFVSVELPANVEAMEALTPASTLKFAGDGATVSIEPVRL